ncbi:SDR family NAD(P)-dependent oxidoreductase [Rhodoflexus caldus]|uniref:SDR family NAD(P)-dependent oxidoreductase n=1 Tax=Rhodoflexus caldus TaxID=2891236 RepID=UPI00202AAD2D|nr:SDR family NAD(P)-dependent oxidoreductase [Rhodoflexus caldus]
MTLTALITGATSGIGLATARTFARNGIDLVLCGRRQERLDALAAELGALVRVHTLNFDVRDADDTAAKIASLPESFRQIDILVNNAGNAYGLMPIQEGEIADWDAMIDINVKGLLYVSKAVIPQMVERKRGHIINIGSLAGQEVYPNGNVYCASKFAVDALTKGMRIDLNQHNIKVTSINPGMVETEFSVVRFKGDTERAKNVYRGMTPLTAEDVADVIWFAASRPAHVNVAEVLLLPTAQANSTIVKREG